MNQPVERESMEVDVLYVGAGPANLASAWHLMDEVERYNERAAAEGKEAIEPPVILIIEKAAEIGDHQLSGAVINPRAIKELAGEDFVLCRNGKPVARLVPIPSGSAERPSTR